MHNLGYSSDLSGYLFKEYFDYAPAWIALAVGQRDRRTSATVEVLQGIRKKREGFDKKKVHLTSRNLCNPFCPTPVTHPSLAKTHVIDPFCATNPTSVSFHSCPHETIHEQAEILGLDRYAVAAKDEPWG
jgi:hypothetical protein